MTCPSVSSIRETEGFGIYTLMHPSSTIPVHLLKTIRNGSFLYSKITTWYKHQWHIATGLHAFNLKYNIHKESLRILYTFSWKSLVLSHRKNTSSSLSLYSIILYSGYDEIETINTILMLEITKYFNFVYNFIPEGPLQAKNYDPNIVSRGQLYRSEIKPKV